MRKRSDRGKNPELTPREAFLRELQAPLAACRGARRKGPVRRKRRPVRERNADGLLQELEAVFRKLFDPQEEDI